MKNYEGQRLNLDIALAMGFVLMGLVGFAVGRHPEDTALLAFFGFCAIAVTIGALRIVRTESFSVPNGLSRPEDELPRKKVFSVSERIGRILRLAPVSGGTLIFWVFESLPQEIQAGRKIVYLDDRDAEFLASWKEQGVIPLLSTKAGAVSDSKSEKRRTEVNEPKPTQSAC